MLGFVGCGNMAQAMLKGILAKGLYKADEIIVSRPTNLLVERSPNVSTKIMVNKIPPDWWELRSLQIRIRSDG